MSTPTTNSDGHLVWKPQVGTHVAAAANQRESYGGIVGALQDTAVSIGATTKAYPHSYAGIIAAIQDLALGQSPPPVLPGPVPDNGAINPNTGVWEPITPPSDGNLWFDTRQGRLFVSINGEWIQTNGADGLPLITDGITPPATEDNPVPGQFWYNQDANQLYIHDGNYIDGDSNLVDFDDPNALPLWRLLNASSDESAQTTATLPLAGNTRDAVQSSTKNIVQEPDLDNFYTQQAYNVWNADQLELLDAAITDKSEVVVSSVAPTNPPIGSLWYDSEGLDLSLYFQDGSGDKFWVPVSAPYTYDADLDIIRQSVTAESNQRQAQVAALQQSIDNIDISSNSSIQTLRSDHTALQHLIANFAAGNYQTSQPIQSALNTLHNKIDTLDIPGPPDLSDYVRSSALAGLSSVVNSLPTQADLNNVISSIPIVSNYVVQGDIDHSIAQITNSFLPRNGGVLNGSFIINKTDHNKAALDFSSSPSSSNKAFKFQSMGTTSGNYITYGTTNSLWEQAWQFAADEDFCWIYNDTDKVFSITKEGPACSQLYIGDFQQNNNSGRVITNRIDVRDRLTAYQSAFEQVRQAVSSSTDYESLKSGLLTALANV